MKIWGFGEKRNQGDNYCASVLDKLYLIDQKFHGSLHWKQWSILFRIRIGFVAEMVKADNLEV